MKELYENIEQGKVFRRENKVIWKCRNCGYLHEGNEPPGNCPACDHPRVILNYGVRTINTILSQGLQI